jgi:DNA adenine methylase
VNRGALRRLRAPFPYFGSKYDVADVVWESLGDPANYVEPFAGSLAVLLGRPHAGKVETVNDYSGLVVNFWRAVQACPVEVARYADEPVHEASVHGWHRLLVESAEGMRESLEADPRWFDTELAGRWAWGASAWLGSGWCDPKGLWKKRPHLAGAGTGKGCHPSTGHGVHGNGVLHRTRPHLSHGGSGGHRNLTQLPHLSGGGETGVGYGRGVHSRAGRQFDGLVDWMLALAERLRFVRVICGDFERCLTRAVTTSHGLTGVFLDPTYDRKMRATRIYEVEDDTASPRARKWAIANGGNPLLRIVLAGLEGEHDMPPNWRCYAWKTGGGYGNQRAGGRGQKNADLERLWLSPHTVVLPRQHQGLLALG